MTKLCPRCDVEPQTLQDDDFFVVQCPKCGDSSYSDSDSQAIEQWGQQAFRFEFERLERFTLAYISAGEDSTARDCVAFARDAITTMKEELKGEQK